MTLAEAMNTYNIALHDIIKRGFIINLEIDESNEEILSWIAKKGNNIISAFSPLSLLALVVICEQYGDSWNSVDTGNIYDEILDNN